jgi:hypothetical protein
MLTDNPKVSVREAILRERRAFEQGVIWALNVLGRRQSPAVIAEVAAEHFPIPVVTRPREVVVEYTSGGKAAFRFVDGRLESRLVSPGDRPYSPPSRYNRTVFNPATWTPEGIMAVADLIENPTETVEVE